MDAFDQDLFAEPLSAGSGSTVLRANNDAARFERKEEYQAARTAFKA